MHYGWNGTLTHLLLRVLTPVLFSQCHVYRGLRCIHPGRRKFYQDIFQLGWKIKIWWGGSRSGCYVVESSWSRALKKHCFPIFIWSYCHQENKWTQGLFQRVTKVEASHEMGKQYNLLFFLPYMGVKQFKTPPPPGPSNLLYRLHADSITHLGNWPSTCPISWLLIVFWFNMSIAGTNKHAFSGSDT